MPTLMEQVKQYLGQYGWTFEAKEEEQLLVTGFQGKTNTFRIFVYVGAPWVMLAIVPFVPHPLDECRERFWQAALRLNYELNLAKLGLDPDGDIALVIELRSEDLRYDEFATALDAISFYADEYYLPLTNLAVDPNYQPDTSWQIVSTTHR